jgi:hypothetical protein
MDWDKTKKIKKGPQQGLKGDKEKGKGQRGGLLQYTFDHTCCILKRSLFRKWHVLAIYILTLF